LLCLRGTWKSLGVPSSKEALSRADSHQASSQRRCVVNELMNKLTLKVDDLLETAFDGVTSPTLMAGLAHAQSVPLGLWLGIVVTCPRKGVH
jgi:hypothetical protein